MVSSSLKVSQRSHKVPGHGLGPSLKFGVQSHRPGSSQVLERGSVTLVGHKAKAPGREEQW